MTGLLILFILKALCLETNLELLVILEVKVIIEPEEQNLIMQLSTIISREDSGSRTGWSSG